MASLHLLSGAWTLFHISQLLTILITSSHIVLLSESPFLSARAFTLSVVFVLVRFGVLSGGVSYGNLARFISGLGRYKDSLLSPNDILYYYPLMATRPISG